MENEILPADGFPAPARWSEQSRRAAAERARRYENSAFSENTQVVYDRAWNRFVTWAVGEGVDPLPVPTPLELISAYLTELADKKSLSSVNVAAAAIASFHEISNCPIDLDALAKLRRGIRNRKGVAPKDKASPFRLRDMARLIEACGPDLDGIRDRAVLLVGFFAALRRSEIVELRFDDVKIDKLGARLRIRRSKTDQAGQGAEIFLERAEPSPFCAVAALENWIQAADITSGALFRRVNRWGQAGYDALSPGAIGIIINKRTKRAGLDAGKFSGHSLRAGFATTAFELDVALADVAKRLRHRNPRTTQGYDRRSAEKDAEKFRILFGEFANDPVPTKVLKADATKPALDDAELRELIRKAEEAQQRVIDRLKQVGAAK